jgi:hypothetical protein
MAKRLIQLQIEHVAGVDRPANKRKFLVIKSEKIEKLSVKAEDGKFCVYDGDKKIGTYESEDAARAAMANMKSEKGATMLTKEQIKKITDGEIAVLVIEQGEELVESLAKVKTLEEEIVKLKAAPPKETTEDPDEEEFWKGVPAIVRNRYENVKKKADDAEKQAKDERDRNDTAEWVVKLQKYTYVPILPERFAPIMKTIAQACPKEAKEIEEVFHTCHEIIGKGTIIFKEVGENGLRGGDATDVVARVNARASEISKRDNVDQGTAIQRVFAEHPDWYGVYRKSSTIGVGNVVTSS